MLVNELGSTRLNALQPEAYDPLNMFNETKRIIMRRQKKFFFYFFADFIDNKRWTPSAFFYRYFWHLD